jgi:outer membrane protein assembly factor BamB
VKYVVMATLLLLPAVACGQDEKADDGKVSNDQPGRPLQMSPASTEVKEALDDFERFQRRRAWERALKALYTIPDEQAARFIDGENGFIVPVARKRRAVLAALSPEAKAAYRLFYDAEAKKLLDEAEGAAELKNLERIYSAYFISSVGDDAADRLGDLYFELGRFDRAADCWLSILRELPDTNLSPALISVKAVLALARAGRRAELEQVRFELNERHADEKVTVAGMTATPSEILKRFLGDEIKTVDAAKPGERVEEPNPNLAEAGEPAWQLRFGDSVEAGMTPPELTQWESNPLSIVVPAIAASKKALFANYLGHVFAVDLETGKMLWRSSAFHHLETTGMQNQFRTVDPTRFAVVAGDDLVWCLWRDLKDQNYFAPFRLTCRRAAGGEVVWQSSDLAEYAQIDLVGPPILVAGKLFISAKTAMNQGEQPHQSVVAIQPHDGKILWKTNIGTVRQGQQFYMYYGGMDQDPLPRLIYRAGAIYVDTHLGILARLDAESGALDWGYGYHTDPALNQGNMRFFVFGGPQAASATAASGPPAPWGEALIVKGAQSDRLYAVEPNRMTVLWERPIAKSSRLLGADDKVAFLGGPELGAIDLKTKELLWSTHLPNGSLEARVVARSDGIWQFTPRGVFEIDSKSGDIRRIFRGNDLGAAAGDLYVTDDLVLTVSNRAISAYPRRAAAARVSTRENKATSHARASND